MVDEGNLIWVHQCYDRERQSYDALLNQIHIIPQVATT